MSVPKPNFILTFENGGFWEYYKDLERQFESFLESVPYLEGNEGTYSFRLLNIFLSIGGHIDSAFIEMARYPLFSSKQSCKEILRRAKDRKGIIESGVRAFDEIYGIASKEVTFKCLPNRMQITPFKEVKPEWWDFYNDLKHDVSISLPEANLNAVRNALAGAFLLNVIHKPARKRLLGYRLIKPKYMPTGFEVVFPRFDGERMYPEQDLKIITENPCIIETPPFIYDYENILRKRS